MSRITISSAIERVGRVERAFSDLEVKNEPMLFNNDLQHAWNQGGPITQAFISELPHEWTQVPLVIDSRVHMLMPGWFPCIPGWHHDDVPRVRADGQPQYKGETDRSEHILMLVNAHLAPTEFALGTASFTIPQEGKVVYEHWHKAVERKIKLGALRKVNAGDRELIRFDDRSWHTGVAAVRDGWRFFIRASRYYNAKGEPIARRNPRTNEIRKQVQVYLSLVNAGW